MEGHILNISKELIKRGHEVTVFTSNLSRTGKIPIKEETVEGIKIRRFNAWFKIGDFASFWPGIFHAVYKESKNADIIHMHSFRHAHNLTIFLSAML